MSNTIAIPVLYVPGPQGPPPITALAASFVQPAAGSTVPVLLASNGILTPGQWVTVATGGYYTVLSVSGSSAAVLTNPSPGIAGNASPGTTIAQGSQVIVAGVPGAAGSVGSISGPLTTVTAGASPTLNAATVQRVNIPTDGAASGIVYPAAPNDGDTIYGKTTGTSVVNAATINPNGNNIESIRSPGTIGAGNITTGPTLGNPAVSWAHVYEASGTVWRLR